MNAEGQPCTEDDRVTLINAPLYSLAGILSTANIPGVNEDDVLADMNEALNGSNPDCGEACKDTITVTENVVDFLYRGYDSKTLLAFSYVYLNYPLLHNAIDTLLGTLGLDELPTQFSLFMGKNGTLNNQWYKINNGRYEKNKLLYIDEFNGQSKLPDAWWPDVGPRPSATSSGMDYCYTIG